MDRTSYKCEHCDSGFSEKRTLVLHEKTCLDSPAVIDGLRAYMREHAEDGRLPTVRHYRDTHGELPGYKKIMRRIGSWKALPEFLGVDLKAGRRGRPAKRGANKTQSHFRRKTQEADAEVAQMEAEAEAQRKAERRARHSIQTNGWERKWQWNPNRHRWEWVQSAEVV